MVELNKLSFQLKLDDGSRDPPVVAKLRQGNVLKRRKPILEVDDSVVPILDLIVLTLVYMETRRRDTETAAAAA